MKKSTSAALVSAAVVGGVELIGAVAGAVRRIVILVGVFVVIVRGLLTKYGSIYETSSKKAYVYSLNGKTE